VPAQPFVLYLHGFLSSPQSKKAQQTLDFCEKSGLKGRILVPQMGNGPAETIDQLQALIHRHKHNPLVLIGSSLGGYYATYLSEEYGFPAVLINPAVKPFELWETHLGRHKNYYTDEIHTVTREHIEELKKLEVPVLSQAQNFMVLIQAGDETLDYRQAVEKFSESNCIVHPNGNHSYENFDLELPEIFAFLSSRILQKSRD